MIWPELTTVRQPVAAMARIAADLIIGSNHGATVGPRIRIPLGICSITNW